jgi:pilus assembly protein CpaB
MPVTEVSSISKLVKPNDRVDLIAMLDMGGGKENKVAKVILQDVVVLSAGRSVTNNAARVLEADSYGGRDKVKSLAEDFSFSSVTLEVDPAQAQALALVMANGDNALSLSLRNNDDTDKLQTSATTFSDVLGADINRARGPAAKR